MHLNATRVLLDLGVRVINWGVAFLPINGRGAHELHRSCDGKTVADYGDTHHTTQWLEALGRTTYLLASSPWAGEYRSTIDRYRRRIDEIATGHGEAVGALGLGHGGDGLVRERLHASLVHARRCVGLASTLAENPRAAVRRAADAKQIATRAVHNQRPSGINPERGGFDVGYQMYGTWLAETYDGTLSPARRVR